jgi:DNA polymerase
MPILVRDYETRSTLKLGDVGAWRYATHAETDVWCCAYAVDDEPVKLWTPGDPTPSEFIEAAQNPDYLVSAFNDQFERLIEAQIMGPRYAWPLIPIERHRCSQAAALSLALPATLEKAANAVQLEQRKDKAGRAVMLKMAAPRRPRKNEDPRLYWLDDPKRLSILYEYCKQDVAVERALHDRIGFLCPEEQAIWLLDQQINDRGLYIDRKLIDSAILLANAARAKIDSELETITGSAVTTINQTQKLISWLGAQGCEVTDVQKPTLTKALTRENLPPEVRRVIELRLDGAHAAANKFETMRGWRNPDGRIRGAFRFHGASTGRWTSLGVQLHNMKRPIVEDMDAAIEAVSSGNLDHYDQPMSIIGDIRRATIIAQPGHRLIIADFSGIESRVLAWLSGQQSKLDQWRKFDQTKDAEDEPYVILGLACGLSRDQARDKGKTADLAFGFQGGEGAYRALAPDDPSTPTTIKGYQEAWRRAHPASVRFWGDINRAAIRAAQSPGKAVRCNDHISFECDDSFLRMRLPSGRKLAYPAPRLKTSDRGELAVLYTDNQGGKQVDCHFGRGAYGGLWTENAVSGTARDIFAAAMLRLESAGYPIVLHVHDEIVAEVPEGFGSTDEFLQIITALPDWAGGLPIAAKVREGERFCKIESKSQNEIPLIEETSVQESAGCAANHDNVCAGGDGRAEEGECNEPNDDQDHSEATTEEKNEPDQEPGSGQSRPDDDHYSSGERPWGSASSAYIYLDENGAPYLRVVRTTAKQFPQYHWGENQWALGKPAGPKIPYRLPELIAAAPEIPVFVCEGEKDADNVADLGLIATTNPEGARKGAWSNDLNRWFSGKRAIYILEDNDEDGRRHASEVAGALKDIAGEIRIVSFPELPPHGDVSDWLEMGGTKAKLLSRAKAGRRPESAYDLVRASDVTPEKKDWAWQGHLLRGGLELLTGQPGMGKSQIQSSMVSSFTTGRPWPDGTNGLAPGNVIMLTAEDNLKQTLIPRLIAASTDCGRVLILKKIRKDGKGRMFLINEDLNDLEKIIREHGIGLVTIDPITAYMGGKIDCHKATDVRSQLGPLRDLAETTGVAISAITHPAKNAGQHALDQFIGSQAFGAVARIGHLCVAEMNDDGSGGNQPTGRALFANSKNNERPLMPTLAYRIEGASGGADPTGEKIEISKIVWDEVVGLTANEALASTSTKKESSSGAVTFLMDMLANGPVPAKRIEERGVARGFSEDQLRRARRKIGAVTFKAKGKLEGGWFWAKPQDVPPEADAEGESA